MVRPAALRMFAGQAAARGVVVAASTIGINVWPSGQVIQEARHNARPGCVLKAGGQLDERRLAESGAKEADSHGQAKEIAQRNVDDGIASDGGQVRGAKEEAIAKDEIGRPGRRTSGRHNAIEMEITQGF